MKWQGRERSSNVEDRRSQGGGLGRMGGGNLGGIRIPMGGRTAGGGLGIVGIIVVLGVLWMLGVNPIDVLTGNTTTSQTSSQWAPSTNANQDELSQFVGVVVKETENLWTEVFRQNNQTYDPPTVVLFTDATQSGCGMHVADVRAGVPADQWCPGHTTPSTEQHWLRRVLGR